MRWLLRRPILALPSKRIRCSISYAGTHAVSARRGNFAGVPARDIAGPIAAAASLDYGIGRTSPFFFSEIMIDSTPFHRSFSEAIVIDRFFFVSRKMDCKKGTSPERKERLQNRHTTSLKFEILTRARLTIPPRAHRTSIGEARPDITYTSLGASTQAGPGTSAKSLY
jgi:hypothetical protein